MGSGLPLDLGPDLMLLGVMKGKVTNWQIVAGVGKWRTIQFNC